VLKNLGDDCIIVNTARKEIINEPDLIRTMNENPGLKYMTDVAPDSHADMAMNFRGRYFSTAKKAGAQTAEANINAGVAAAEQIVDFFEHGDIGCKVN
jgi:D-3-phosphoglycerate dehydrogenase